MKIVKKCYHALQYILIVILGIPRIAKVTNESTYYTELARKSKRKRYIDNLIWLIKYHEVNKFYNLYGLDTIELGRNVNEYNDYYSFERTRNKTNGYDQPYSQIILLRDKFLFFKYMRSFKLPVPEVFALCRKGRLLDADLKDVDENYIKGFDDYFVKEVDGECASFVKHVRTFDDYKKIEDEINKYNCIFQARVIQSEKINKLNPHAVNTIRIVTVSHKGAIEVLAAELRIGTKSTGVVDNAAVGGIVVGIKEDGSLNDYGLCKYGAIKRVMVHPDTGVVFGQYKIQNYEVVKTMACKAHSVFYNIHSIGWDIAIGENGPIFIEGNDNWEISGLQAANGGLRKQWMEAIK